MNQSFEATKYPENNWQISKILDDQELDICFKVYSWQKLIIEKNKQTASIQYFPFFSTPDTSKLVNLDVQILQQNNFLDFIESEFTRLDRRPAVCLNLNHPDYDLQVKFLYENGYSPLPNKETIMIYKEGLKDSHKSPESKVPLTDCQSFSQQDIFIDIFNKAYFDGNNQITKGYEYIIRKSFEPNPDYKVENFTFPSFENSERMVACASLVTDKFGAAKIYCVGVLPEFRKQGLAFMMLEKVVHHWLSFNQKDYLSIHTTADSSPERLYTKLGFERVCLQETWVKN
jgi:ribosomal protein S18 acetylase RimI-like enzyme